MRTMILAAMMLLVAVPTHAAARCYSSDEVKAEQLLRLHSELMVITVTCRQGSMGRDLPMAYAKFTRDNIAALHDAEAKLIAFYKKNYGGSGIERLDKLRTRLANEYGQQIANLSAPLFCAQRRDKVTSLCDAQQAAISDEVGRLCLAARTEEKPCDVAAAQDSVIVAQAGKRP